MAASLAVVALCALAVATGVLRDAVLCRGDDGHLSIERALAGACDSRSGAEDHLTPAFAASAQEGCCGPCRDVSWPDATFVASSFPASGASHSPNAPGPAWVPHPVTTGVPLGSSARWTIATPAVRSLRLESITVLRC